MLDKMMEDFIANPPYISQSKYEEKLNEYIARWPEHEELIRSRLERAMRLEAACLAAYNYGGHNLYETMDAFNWRELSAQYPLNDLFGPIGQSFAFYADPDKTWEECLKRTFSHCSLLQGVLEDIQGA